jgi:hypothetical protein
MRRHGSWGVAAVVLAVSAAPRAEAGKKTKVAGELRCEVPKGNGRIGGDIPCTLRVTADDPDDMSGLKATVQTRWTTKVAKQKQKAKHTGRVRMKEPIEVGEVMDVALSPITLDDGPVDFEPCVPFEISATIESGAGGVVWSKTIKVPQRCATPKAKLACTYVSGDGKRRDALTGKNRIESAVTCELTKLPADAGAAWITTRFDSYDADGNPAPREARADSAAATGRFTFTLEPDTHFESCGDATISVHVVDGRELPLYSKSVTMKQYCPD